MSTWKMISPNLHFIFFFKNVLHKLSVSQCYSLGYTRRLNVNMTINLVVCAFLYLGDIKKLLLGKTPAC